ncbi:7-hydroxymethyl chlorophyll a reductase, chloroplastic [Vitis vinifera]|uniref:7-hydroxymethyl chlorophyll a reductase, chloroplastic n=1 Tax=Vitis vinifera TaxID=29760 RepID=A0A438IJ96_VITVI|nr:7-hydroxymethyl chlorophyll a reductase, chloroplastic [Vitis vinifera]
MDSLIHVWWVSVWLTTIVGSPSSLLPWLVSPPQSFHSLLFLLLPLPLPKLSCWFSHHRRKLQPKSVKLRDDWRQRSRPIPPGGTYPAKDHCSRCGLCDTYYIAHVKNACAFLGMACLKLK